MKQKENKKIGTIIVLALCLASVMPATAQTFAGGDGTAAQPFLISTPQQLSNLREFLGDANKDKHFKLANDIDLSTFSAETWGTHGWDPIGTTVTIWDRTYETYPNAFCAHLDGNNHKIIGLWSNRTGVNNIGLFGSVAVGLIENLTVVTDDAKKGITGNNYCGIMCGYSCNMNFTNCAVSGTLTGENNLGGFTGGEYGFGDGKYINCHSSVIVSGDGSVGGFSGRGGSTFLGCYSAGDVSGKSEVGGFSGVSSYGIFTDCYSTATVNATSIYSGGFAGNGSSTTFTDCYATGDVNGGGGFAGGFSSGGGTYNKCYATGNVTGTLYLGGFLGSGSGTATNCYAVGNVTGSSSSVGGFTGGGGKCSNCYSTGAVLSSSYYVGGFAGTGNGSFTDCYTTSDVSGKSDVGGFVGYGTGDISNCYAAGVVTGTTTSGIGGFSGYNLNGAILNCYYLQRDNQNGVGRGRESDNITAIPTEAAMMKKSSFPGFFNSQTIWDIREGKSYPFLNGVGSYIPAGVELADTEQSAIWSADGILFVQATQPTVVQIYTLSGVLLKSAPVGIGTTTFSLPSGLCIVKTTNSSQMLLIR